MNALSLILMTRSRWLWSICLGITIETAFVIAGRIGEWREDGPMSLGSTLYFWPHVPAILLGDFLGLRWPSGAILWFVSFVNGSLAVVVCWAILSAIAWTNSAPARSESKTATD